MRLLVLLLAGVTTVQAQVVLTLPAPDAVGDAGVSVSRVIDLRADTTTVGEARVGLTNRRRPVLLEGGTVAAVGDYLRAALPAAPGREALVVGIDVLLVSERATVRTEFGRAEVQLRWFRPVGDGLAEVARTPALAEGTGIDVTRGHDDRLAAALDESVAQLVADGLSEGAEPVALSDLTASPLAVAPVSLTEAAERSYRNVITGGAIVGGNATGGRLSYGLRPITDAVWSFPLVLEASVLRTDDGRGNEGVFSTYGGTIQAARRLGQSSVYLQPGLQITGGTEDAFGDDTFFFGGRLGLDIVRYPAEKGLVAGIGVYGTRLFGSEVYPSDLGVSVTLGGQF